MRIAKRQLAGSGEALPAGAIGETISVIGTTQAVITTTSGAFSTTLAQCNLKPGVWMLIPFIHGKENAGYTGTVRFGAVLSTSPTASWFVGAAITDGQVGITLSNISGSAAEFSQDVAGLPLFVNVSAETIYYLRGTSFNNLSTGSIVFLGAIKALRIA